MDVVFRPVKLGSVVADLSSLFRAAIERGGIELIVDCQPEPIEGKPVYLACVLALLPTPLTPSLPFHRTRQIRALRESPVQPAR
jgi:hypothetical protein